MQCDQPLGSEWSLCGGIFLPRCSDLDRMFARLVLPIQLVCRRQLHARPHVPDRAALLSTRVPGGHTVRAERHDGGGRVSSRRILCRGQQRSGALLARELLQHDWSVGRVGRLQRGPLLSGRVDIGDAARVPSAVLLPGIESQRDNFAHFVLLQCERHERADRVRRGLVLQPNGSERRGRAMQRRVLLRPRFIDCHGEFVRCGHVLSSWQQERSRLSAGRVLLCARTGQLHAKSDWQLLQFDGPLCLHPLHARVVLRHVWAERADGQLQRRVPVPGGLQLDVSIAVPGDHLLSRCESRGRRVPRVGILRQYGHERRDAVHKRLILRSRWTVSAKRSVRSGSLLRDGLEHGEAVPMHEWHLLPAWQL